MLSKGSLGTTPQRAYRSSSTNELTNSLCSTYQASLWEHFTLVPHTLVTAGHTMERRGSCHNLGILVACMAVLQVFCLEQSCFFQQLEAKGTTTKPVLARLTARSKLTCAWGCARLPGCMSFSLMPGPQVCSLYSRRVFAWDIDVSSSNPETFYYRRYGGFSFLAMSNL